MNYWKLLAIIFLAFSLGAIQETYRIFTSTDSDVLANRAGLIPIALIFTTLFLLSTLWLWQKSRKNTGPLN